MSAAPRRPDVERELNGLKDFQRRTVEYAHRRLWEDEDSSRRFLVADEVGLGKTLVARGLIAKTIDHLWESPDVDRIDIVYICSSQQIAAQNIRTLDVADYGISKVDRLTMLPTQVRNLAANKVNLLSLTPGTSFNISQSGGRSQERVLVQHMLAQVLGEHVVHRPEWLAFFRGTKRPQNYAAEVAGFDPGTIDVEILERFRVAVLRAPGLGLRLEEAAGEFASATGNPDWPLSHRRYRLIGELRRLVAQASVDALEPDLVILDEFQRFKSLLHEDTEMSELADAVFNHESARVVLLSATPYSMYSVPEEGVGDDHYGDFLKTYRFLTGASRDALAGERADDGSAAVGSVGELQTGLRRMRDAALADDVADGTAAAAHVTDLLRAVMCRTERLAATPDRDGMLVEKDLPPARPTADDVRALRRLHEVAQEVGSHRDVLEYWRVAPYVLQFMDGYDLKQKALLHVEKDDSDFSKRAVAGAQRLRGEEIERYAPVDPANGRLRWLLSDLDAYGFADVPWIPASLPYYAVPETSPFHRATTTGLTKRLIFSAWNVAPKSIAAMTSYHVERKHHRLEDAHAYSDRHSYLLRWRKSPDGRLASMPLLPLVLPLTVLGAAGDPVAAARELGTTQAPLDAVRAVVRAKVENLLAELPSGHAEGRGNEQWYWAAPLFLEKTRAPKHFSWGRKSLDYNSRGGEEHDGKESALALHIARAKEVDEEFLAGLGPRPDDLADVLTDLALAAPATAAYRALYKTVPEGKFPDVVWDSVLVGMAMRTLLDGRSVAPMVRGWAGASAPQWRNVLTACVEGNLQAVLDEYFHVMDESSRIGNAAVRKRLERLTAALWDAAQTGGSISFDEIVADGDTHVVERRRLRADAAARFGRVESDQGVRADTSLRDGFNSPFWPFVLASTSIGQEGLDFHRYCHAVVHWNLPNNPVDMEQREGRVHRYKGHAVRKNVAREFSTAALEDDAAASPWDALFAAGERARPDGESEIYPYWVCQTEGGAKIERYVPQAPLSAERIKHQNLLRALGAYRMALGQPRQQELLHLLGMGAESRDLEWMRLDLSPLELEDRLSEPQRASSKESSI